MVEKYLGRDTDFFRFSSRFRSKNIWFVGSLGVSKDILLYTVKSKERGRKRGPRCSFRLKTSLPRTRPITPLADGPCFLASYSHFAPRPLSVVLSFRFLQALATGPQMPPFGTNAAFMRGGSMIARGKLDGKVGTRERWNPPHPQEE